MGSFNLTISGLVVSTTYYVRAYAENATGVAYGAEVSFQTLPISCPGTPTVTDLDGNTYRTVQIGTQCWMSSNLRVSKYSNGDSVPTGLSNADWTSTTAGAYYQHSTNNSQDSLFGKIYNGIAAADQRGLCPTGWGVPSDADWTRLVNHIDPAYDTATGSSATAGGALKSRSGWATPNTGATNSTGFQAVGSGERADNTGQSHGFVGNSSAWWSSTSHNSGNNWYRQVRFDNAALTRGSLPFRYGFPVRCIKKNLAVLRTEYVTGITTTEAVVVSKLLSGGSTVSAQGIAYGTSPSPSLANDTMNSPLIMGDYGLHIRGLQSSTLYFVRSFVINADGVVYGNQLTFTTASTQACPGTPTVTDVDGNVYNTVQIGTQCWTLTNLKVRKYRNGNGISTNLDNSQWASTTSGAFAVYGNDATNADIYGNLYNWYAVNDSRGLCPTGWHVPSDAEWTTLEGHLGGSSMAGGAMKSTGTTLWSSPNTGATNSSGFTALPGGYRINDGGFNFVGSNGYWWSSSSAGSGGAWSRVLGYGSANVYRGNDARRHGFSVRCARD
jgi:uncharacterized protein (TIGR02145 family)